MCDVHHARPPRRAIALEHGAAHDRDHAQWTRRDFLVRSGLAVAAGGMALNGTPVRALSRSPLLEHLARLDTDRVLVLLQLNGGNDGLNTVVPKTNDLYYAARPTLGIPSGDTIGLSDDYGLHPAMEALEPVWGEGRMGVLHSVGYPDPDLSHFRSTDIWVTASDADETLQTGWAGRYLDAEFPDFGTAPPDYPPAVQIGTSTPLLFQGAGGAMGMSVLDVDLFLQIAQGGTPYDPLDVPPLPYGDELAYVREVANASFRYLDAIQAATDAGSNDVAYPGGPLAAALSATARLIKGELGARVYLVGLGGFDTHANQTGQHAALLQTLAEAVAAFHADLGVTGHGDRVLTATFSEFGRRIAENGSAGTDHGTAAPLFVFGDGVAGGLYGDGPDLADTDEFGNLLHSTDFRAVYATLLREWFGLSTDTAADVLGGSFGTVPFVGQPVPVQPAATPAAFGLDAPFPNPARTSTTLRFHLSEAGAVRLDLYTLTGRRVTTLASGMHRAGTHAVSVALSGLPSGTYVCRLEAAGVQRSQKLTLVR